MRIIVAEEGSRPVKPRLAAAASSSGGGRSASGAGSRGKTRVVETVYRRGQGLEGLWRGWKRRLCWETDGYYGMGTILSVMLIGPRLEE
ncbi:hypothetical protein VTK73DRAFT_3802 [Phialemonium thermophilum]|uniref:Uncharacterized protein n=1 Tax=Phialemonium thermophilum TaxID=223376 RepID=A0ABR3VEM0_9PEZI